MLISESLSRSIVRILIEIKYKIGIKMLYRVPSNNYNLLEKV